MKLRDVYIVEKDKEASLFGLLPNVVRMTLQVYNGVINCYIRFADGQNITFNTGDAIISDRVTKKWEVHRKE